MQSSSSRYELIALITINDNLEDASELLRECVENGIIGVFIQHPENDDDEAEKAARRLAKDFPFYPIGIPRSGSATSALLRDVECNFSMTWCLFQDFGLDQVDIELQAAEKTRVKVMRENRHQLLFAS
ncbi:MAG: hypothetical protein ING75_07610, partial [Rhodocyclaceae bacterium]|nr:hypothetical protein [Rhodocyclaceae bacterium]